MNPLSNFFPSKVLHDGIAYHCSEQFIQHSKAKFFKSTTIAECILEAETGLECKQLSREIVDYDHENWKTLAKDLCEDGIASKFLQKIQLQKHLRETGDKTIVECCRDTLWGTGVPDTR